jgi:hypothetical protein
MHNFFQINLLTIFSVYFLVKFEGIVLAINLKKIENGLS